MKPLCTAKQPRLSFLPARWNLKRQRDSGFHKLNGYFLTFIRSSPGRIHTKVVGQGRTHRRWRRLASLPAIMSWRGRPELSRYQSDLPKAPIDQTLWRSAVACKGPVCVVQTPAQHLLGVLEHTRGICRVTRAVVKLAGIGLEVEEERWQGIKVHVFVSGVLDDRQPTLIDVQIQDILACTAE